MTWVRYYVNQFNEKDDQFEYFNSKEGVCMIENLRFKVNDDLGQRTVKAGTYELRITDVTAGLKPSMKAKP